MTLKKGTVRGLHFQFPPKAETKIVSCIKGKVWDVALDLRKESKTFLHHHAVFCSFRPSSLILISRILYF
mgnify:CR=1 FL=1